MAGTYRFSGDGITFKVLVGVADNPLVAFDYQHVVDGHKDIAALLGGVAEELPGLIALCETADYFGIIGNMSITSREAWEHIDKRLTEQEVHNFLDSKLPTDEDRELAEQILAAKREARALTAMNAGVDNPAGPVRGELREAVFNRDNYQCRYCRSIRDLTIDHVLPGSRGGTNMMENLVTACRSCNSSKGNRTPLAAGMFVLALPEYS